MPQSNNLWEVEINNQIHQADEETIKFWLIDGKIKLTTRVRKNTQDWIEVSKLVKLQPATTDQKTPLTDLDKAQIPTVVAAENKNPGKDDHYGEIILSRKVSVLEPIFYHQENWEKYLKITCQYHPELFPEVLCPECGGSFCKHCAAATVVGGGFNKASQCQVCGALCRPYSEIKEKLLALTEQNSNFGWEDLQIAFKFPAGLDLAPIVVFTVLSAFSFAAFPTFITISILTATVISAVKDAASGEKAARKFDYTSFLSSFPRFLLIGLGAILVIFAPLIATVIGTLKTFSFITIIGLGWAIFYAPIALLVVGLTESFAQVVNLKIGFDVVKKIGNHYQKFFVYFFLLEVPLIIFYFMLPEVPIIEQDGIKMINVIGIFIYIGIFGLFGGIPFFYLVVAMAALVGRVIFKTSDRLGLLTKATTKL